MMTEIDQEEFRIRQRSIVEMLNERRKVIKMSLRELESCSGIPHSTISDVFRRHDIRLWQVFAIAQALDLTIPVLFMSADGRYQEIIMNQVDFSEYE